jgi:hypothetical protein
VRALLNDVWHPWWNASVNGQDAEILKANVVFRAVQVSAGKNVIRFSFKPLDGALNELIAKMAPQDEKEDEPEKDNKASQPQVKPKEQAKLEVRK